MTKRTTGVLKVCLVITVVFLVMLASVPVFASSTPDPNAPPGPSVSPSSTPAPTGGLQVTGYRLENNNSGLNTTDQIHKYNTLTVVLTIHDDRDTVIANPPNAPLGRLNTDSFTMPIDGFASSPPNNTGNGITYEVRFQNMTYTGIGKVFRCDLFYNDNQSIPVVSYELTIHQCVEYVAPSSSSEASSSSSSSAVVKGTGFVLQQASYGQDTVYAGQPFTLTATLLATNGDHNVENVTVGITPAKELSLQDGSSLAYIGTVKPGQSVPAEFRLIPGANVEAGSYTAVIDIKGVDAKTGEAVSASVSISVPVVQPERFEIFSTQLPSDMTANTDDGSGYGTITLVNQGKGAVANVAVEIVGAGLTTEEGKQYVGHVNGGEQKTADFNIKASEPGQIAAQVVVSYENTRGEKKELTYEFTLTVEDGGMMDPGMMDPMPMPEPEPQGGMPVWGWVLIALAVVAIVVVAIILLKKRKAKKAAALEDDYDEDE